jgi:hypothetical protein
MLHSSGPNGPGSGQLTPSYNGASMRFATGWDRYVQVVDVGTGPRLSPEAPQGAQRCRLIAFGCVLEGIFTRIGAYERSSRPW